MISMEWQDGIAVLRLQREETLNALDSEMMAAWRSALDQAVERGAKAIVVTGRGRAFSAGGDVRWFARSAERGSEVLRAEIAQAMEDEGNPLAQAMRDCPVPTVAAVNGACAGGAVGLVLLCDIVVAARSAFFLLPQVQGLGIVPDLGATWAVGRLLGRARALGLALLGERISADRAEQWGLIWQCVDDAELLERALAAARRLVRVPAEVVTSTRTLADASVGAELDTQLAADRHHQKSLVGQPFFLQACADFAAGNAGRA